MDFAAIIAIVGIVIGIWLLVKFLTLCDNVSDIQDVLYKILNKMNEKNP
jgi:hypothetical protein